MNGRQKGSLFWKVAAVLFLLWLFMSLWAIRYHYHGEGLVRINKFTGSVTYHDQGAKWKPMN